MKKILSCIISLLLGVGVCFADSETTVGGRTATAHLIQEEGVSLRPRHYLNFIGSAVTCVDNNGKTECTITSTSGGSGGTATIYQEDGANGQTADTVNFLSGFDKSHSGSTMSLSLDFTEVSITADSVVMKFLNSPTYSTLQHAINFVASSGRISGGTVSDATGEQVTIDSGTGWIKALDDDVADIYLFDWAEKTGVTTTTDAQEYIKVSYNAGNPITSLESTENWDLDTSFPLASIVNEGGELHILNNPWWTSDGITNVIERLQAEGNVVRDDYVGGLVLSVPGTRNIAVTAGTLWSRLNEFAIPALDTTVAGTVETYWRSAASTWTEVSITQYPITQYNRLSDNTLQTIDNNQYFNWWVYAEADDLGISMVYPQAQYANVASAEAESSPTSLPVHIREHGILIGRIICKQGVDAPVQVDTAWGTVFNASQAADHGNLAGLSDDDHAQYLLANATRALTDNWDVGNYDLTFKSATGDGTIEGATITEGGNAVYNSSETPGGELGGTWGSPTIDDSLTVDGWSLGSPTITTKMTLDYATASELVSTNASKELVSLAVATYPSLAELAYVKGVTSAIQTQFSNILDGTTAFTDFNGAVIDSDNLASTVVTGLDAVGTFESGDTFICNEAGVGVRECDYDDLPGGGTMSQFYAEDGDGTEVTIDNDKEWKFVEGSAIDINFTDVDNGTDADPYDLTFSLNINGLGADTLAAADEFVFYDDTGGANDKITYAGLEDAILGGATDLDADGAVAWGNVTAGELGNDSIINEDIDDDGNFVFTGNWDFGGSSNFEIPQDQTVDTDGEITVDGTSGQFRYHDGTAQRTLTYRYTDCRTLETPTDDDDNIPVWAFPEARTITDVHCYTEGGTSIAVTISDGTNALEAVTCDADGADDDGSITNGTFTANENIEWDFAAPTGTVDWVKVCITTTVTAD